MADAHPHNGSVQVNDRRRFDPDGNARAVEPEAPEAAAQEAAAAEAPPATEAAPDVAAENEQLKAELAATRKRVDELARAFQALDRDREDFKQRLTRERERMLDVDRGDMAIFVIEAIDELDLCLDATQDDSPLAQGVRLIRDNMLKKLESVGVARLSTVGQPFDPNLAEAVDMEVTSEPEADQRVVDEVRAGYRLKERVIRPARVKVAKYVQPADA